MQNVRLLVRLRSSPDGKRAFFVLVTVVLDLSRRTLGGIANGFSILVKYDVLSKMVMLLMRIIRIRVRVRVRAMIRVLVK